VTEAWKYSNNSPPRIRNSDRSK